MVSEFKGLKENKQDVGSRSPLGEDIAHLLREVVVRHRAMSVPCGPTLQIYSSFARFSYDYWTFLAEISPLNKNALKMSRLSRV